MSTKKGKTVTTKKDGKEAKQSPWKAPGRTDSKPKKGMEDCKHKFKSTTWLKLTQSKIEGRPEFNLMVVQTMLTKSCDACTAATTSITATKQPDKEALGRHFGSVKHIPAKMLKALGEPVPERPAKKTEEKAVEPPTPEPEADLGDLGSPYDNDPARPVDDTPPSFANLDKVDAVELDDPEVGVEDELDVEIVSNGEMSLPGEAHAHAAPTEFWKTFRTYEMVQRHNNDFRKNGIEPSPFGAISMLLKDLQAERHAMSGEHDFDRMSAGLAEASKEVCADFEQIQKFALLVRNMSPAEKSPAQEELVAFWQLGIDKDGESVIEYGSNISTWLFDWLGVPEEDFFPAGLRRVRRDREVRQVIGERGKDPTPEKDASEVLETLEKRDEELAQKRQTDAALRKVQKAEEDRLKKIADEADKIREERKKFEGKHHYPDKAMSSEWIEKQGRMALGRVCRIEGVHTYSDEATGEHGAIPLLPPRAGFDMDADSEQLLTAVSLYSEEAGTRTLILNLTDSNLAVRSVMTEDGPLVLICQPTVRPRGAK